MSADHPSRPLLGRVALVTGSSQGIGRAIAVRLAEGGADVVGVDVSDQDESGELVRSTGARWAARRLDVADEAKIQNLARQVRQDFGRLDILVNNAGIDDPIGYDELDFTRWRRVVQVNLDAPFLLIKAFVPLMREHSFGRIINISSGSVVNPMPGFVAYRASKIGLIGMTRALSTELGRDGITANVVSPGVVATPMSATSLTPTFLQATVDKQGVKRSGEPKDIAGAVAFVAGPESGFITGQTLMVNGGAAFT